MIRLLFAAVSLLGASGCGLLPVVSYQPVVQNPFPQLSRVAVAPFFNQSDEKTVDGRAFAIAYYNELQATPGFDVVPVGVVEEAMIQHRIGLNSPEEARRLAQLLKVDAVVVGTVTDFSPYYPPRCGLRVEWWAANPSFHPIPAGYGLPWGTPEEEYIPAELVYQAELTLAREQMATQTPDCGPLAVPVSPEMPSALQPVPEGETLPLVEPTGHAAPLTADAIAGNAADKSATAEIVVPAGGPVPSGWPDPRGFVPEGPALQRPACLPSGKPVLEHTSIYHGNDAKFTAALDNYYYFRDDARYGGWQTLLQRSDEFIRFCCHLHIAEMLTARGGAAETRVVWRWADDR